MDIKQKSIVIGAVMGGIIGGLAGMLFARGLETPTGREIRNVSVRDLAGSELVKILISTIALVRSIAELGEEL
ncbi:MAG TPA: YtxH domain-containing protein [Anaerolineae bacterium]|nr:YtxH domain-containing protein [Anaerolineae bacterium]